MSSGRWDLTGLPDLSGRRALVTGANSGIGLETAVHLARAGAAVCLACRNPERGAAASAQLRRRVADADVDVLRLDLADLGQVASAAATYLAARVPLDMLVNNAGVMAVARGSTADGFETQMGVNHLGHFALTGRLLPALLARPGARVVTLSSLFARLGRLRGADLWGERHYWRWLSYAGAKLANLQFAMELDRRSRAAGTDLVSVAAHPGYANTELTANGPLAGRPQWLRDLATASGGFMAQPADLGALPSVYAACAPEVRGGQYIGPDSPLQARGNPRAVRLPRPAHDAGAGARLWDASVAATGVDYGELRVLRRTTSTRGDGGGTCC